MPSQSESLRIAWLVYRGNPHCGGQGVYTRYLARELTDLGHRVTVFSGQPYPELDPGVALLTKPYSYGELAAKVRDVLDAT